MKRYLALMTATAALAFASPAQGHVPNPGLAAGHFSVPTKDMCPLGGNGDRCTWHGVAHCQRNGTAHSVNCLRVSVDKVHINGNRLRMVWAATGTIDHRYKPHNLRFRIIGWSTW